MENLRDDILSAFESHAKGHIDKHIANVNIYLAHPVGIGEHSDIMDAIEIEMTEIAKYDDHLEMLKKYFKD
jgi:hypothetical protein